MNPHPQPESRLRAWIEEGAVTGPRAGLDEALARIGSTRQYPTWLAALRGGSMETTWRPVPVTGVRLIFALLVGSLLVVLIAGALTIGARLLATPAPTRLSGQIAFDAEGDIWLVDEDGTDARRITQTTASELSPSWSPDGRHIANAVGTAITEGIVISAPDGTVERTLEPPDGITLPAGTFPMWRSDATSITAHGTDAQGKGVVVRWDADTGVGAVLDLPIEAGDSATSPDGSMIAFQHTDASGLESVYAARLDGSDVQRLTPDDSWATFWPGDRTVFTPDGKAVVFQVESYEGSDGDIAMTELNYPRPPKGSCNVSPRPCGMTDLVGGPTNDLAPNISPDGRTLAFIRDPGPSVRVSPSREPVELFVVPMDGSAQPRALEGEVCKCQPSWSPDSTRVATWTPDWSQIVIFTLDGSAPPVFVPTPGNLGSMSWSPVVD